ncbi:hypothetical protein E1176_09415 [Fulvivirga sp. RKSG066]|uniref:POTRA domain-containing protein n=1 Tax=Fulvivirga aurantia TaxID=2529383 RepID=UPI0012BC1CE3|nr:POTRA domain-containing protein [Fulvivirga aurantia]MTI21237.1 hypothetical protein [Fulvivirga aurantia]
MLTILLSFLFSISSATDTVASVEHTSIQAKSDSTVAERVTIDKIFIIGNKKTRKKIILRELDVKEGEVYDTEDLEQILKADKNKITNLRLFTSVEVTTLHLSPTLVDIVIQVSERWYTFPAPIFDLVDRNFNDWWQNQNHDLSRTNYGVRIYQNNFRGRNETLRLILQFGYTKKFGLSYRIPYIDRSQRHGLSFGFDYSENKNVPYTTSEHKQVFLDSEDLLRVERSFYLGYRFRNSFYTRHNAYLTFNSNAINDTLATLNPNFYQAGSTLQRYFEFMYVFQHDKRDIVAYPLHGSEFEVEFRKSGLGIFNDINQYKLHLRYTKYIDLQRNFYLANYTSTYFSGPEEQPYDNLGALGYKNDFVRGYELFLIEGQRYFLNRTTLKKKLFSFRERLNFIPVEQFRDFPLAVYIKTYFDFAYTENIERYDENFMNTSLTNQYIYGTGFGLDFVTSYDTVIRFEYSFTKENTSGFFFHLKKEF